MASVSRPSIHVNPSAKSFICTPAEETESCIVAFHHSLPDFDVTKLIPLDDLAREIRVKHVYLKDETTRLGLPSFKILGASWAVFRATTNKLQLPLSVGLKELGFAAKSHSITFYAATDGNHGRAVARMGRLLGVKARIFVPEWLDLPTRDFIVSEDASLMVVDGDYDLTVQKAAAAAHLDEAGILVQDTAWEGYEIIPQWIVDGYATMLNEVDEQLNGHFPDIVVAPVGVGSFAQAVVTHSKAAGRGTAVVTVEPHNAACLRGSLLAGKPTSIATKKTIMSGMNCGTVSSIAWPVLKSGVDASVTISDLESHEAVQYLQSKGISAGPCGAGTLAALKYIARAEPKAIRLNSESTVVLFCTEGSRDYQIPLD